MNPILAAVPEMWVKTNNKINFFHFHSSFFDIDAFVYNLQILRVCIADSHPHLLPT